MHDHNDWLHLAEQQAAGSAEAAGKGCLAIFYDKAVPDAKATREQGRQCFKTRTYVNIRVPGDSRTVIDEPVKSTYSNVTEDPRLRWPNAWRAYQAKDKGFVDGTPIESWPLLSVTQVAELKHANIPTIEALAEVHDGNLGALGMGARELRERARQFVQGSSATEKDLRRQISDQDEKIRRLEGMVEKLTAEDRDRKASSRRAKEAA